MTSEEFDYVIVGGGSAGCVLANRLSAHGNSSVLLLEAGREDKTMAIRVPAALMKLDASYHWGYEAEPDGSRGGAVDKWPAGKVLGGGSSVNAMLWVRGAPADFDHWESLGCAGWGYDAVLPYFRKAETFAGDASPARGNDGPQDVDVIRMRHPMTTRFLEAAWAAGLPRNPDYNAGDPIGAAPSQVSQKSGMRANTARAYLKPARRRANLTVSTESVATRVVTKNGVAVGVEYLREGEPRMASARREVIVACGALASPKLLLLSGVGPAEQLREHGIEVVADLPGVGQNLQEHPHASMTFDVTERTVNLDVTPIKSMKAALEFLFRRSGPVSSPFAHAVGFLSLDDEHGWPDVEFIYAPFGLTTAAADSESGEWEHDVSNVELAKHACVTLYPAVLHPHSRGEIRLRSGNPLDPPLIRHELLGDARDVAALTAACRRMREIFATEPMHSAVTEEKTPGPDVQSDDEFEQFLRSPFTFGGAHPVGTCKMGADDDAVLDEQLRVRGVSGLRVVDASVMPTLTSGNTNAPTIMIAERAADLILGQSLDMRPASRTATA